MKNQFVIIDLRTREFMDDGKGNIKYYDTKEDARLDCAMYELENVWVMELIYNYIEPI